MRIRLFATLAVISLVGISGPLIASSEVALASTALQSGAPPGLGPIWTGPPGSTTITLKAALSPNGSDTTYVFDYGTTTAYGSTTPSQDAGSGTALVTVSAQLSGLTPGTTYHFDLVATNSGGTVSSGDLAFTTTAAGTTTTTLPTGALGPPPTVSAAEQFIAVPVATAAGSWSWLGGVTCVSSFCLAVGREGRGSGAAGNPLVEHWTGTSFKVFPSPKTPGASLFSISCISRSNCLTVGHDGHNTYAAHWNGHGWRVEPAPSPVTSNGDILVGVSCVSATNCWAAGYTDFAATDMKLLIEHWIGGRWSIVSAPSPHASLLNGISCASATNCWAVGALNAFPQAGNPLVEHWNGRGWSIVRTPGSSGQFDTVSCRALTMCWAIGSTTSSALVLHFVNGSWRQVPASVQLSLIAISCATARDCWSVGYGGGAQWNGTLFATAKMTDTGFVDVACLTTTQCLAVGMSGTMENPGRAIADVTSPS
jgi:hypothetical protein